MKIYFTLAMMRTPLLFLLILNLFPLVAQQPKTDFYLKHSLRQGNESYQFTVLDGDEKGVKRFDNEKFYYWFKAQRVMATQGGASGALLDGPFEAFYDNKQLSQKGEFKRGLKHGEWIYWRNDGTMVSSEQWSRGKHSGKQLLYDAEGKLTETIRYKRNSKSRRTADSLVISRNGRDERTVYTFDSIGNVRSKAHYENGVQEGKAKHYQNGKLIKTERYSKGKPTAQEQHKNPENHAEKKGFKDRIHSLFEKQPKGGKENGQKEKVKKKEKGKGEKKRNAGAQKNVFPSLFKKKKN